MEYKLPSGEAAITDECSGGYSFTMSVPLKAKDRNKALHECLQELLSQQKEILSLRQEVERLRAQQDSKTITMLFGLMGYLTSMEEPITFSAYHNATSGADILLRLMEANQLKGDCNWDGFKPPKEQDHE